MQGILSSMMLRDYYQYGPEDVQIFRSINTRSNSKHNHQKPKEQETIQATAAT